MISHSDLFNPLFDGQSPTYIFQQCSCASSRGNELSKALTRYQPSPYRNGANYNPGTYLIISKKNNPAVVCLFAQICSGKANEKSDTDNSTMRLKYFKTVLKKLANYLEKKPSDEIIFIPYKIGCCRSKGNWKNYKYILDRFAISVKQKVYLCYPPNIKIPIVKKSSYKVIMAGDRYWNKKNSIINELAKLPKGTTIIHGGCRGADKICAGYASRAHGKEFTISPYYADWSLGRKAGPLRNKQMLDQRPDKLIIFHENINKSKGSKNINNQALKLNIKVVIINY